MSAACEKARRFGDIAWFVGIEPGHLVGSLDHVEAAKFADLCDTYISPPPAA